MKPISLLLTLLAALLSPPVPSWSGESDRPPSPPPPPRPVEEPELRAELIPRQFTTLSSEMAARIIQSPFREGDHFAKGDLLISFNCEIQQARLNRAKAALLAESAKAKVLDRLDSLNVTSKMELAVARAEEEKAQAELAIIRAELNACRIIAPFAGQVVSLAVREHQYVKPGETLMEIQNPGTLELAFNMPSRWLQRFSRQERFLVRIDETGKSYPARLHAFGARIDAVSQQVKVLGEIIGAFPELSPGMSGRVTLDLQPPPPP
ncbi:MAG: efflux RND transporter periplasmic adaptor subunit [Magnetococcales bacterium]|nr:efflux RND transporter periplasmic adaptor subunit [Magnetococcales bacterium]